MAMRSLLVWPVGGFELRPGAPSLLLPWAAVTGQGMSALQLLFGLMLKSKVK